MPAGHVLNPNKAATRFRGPMLYGAPAILGEGAVNGESTEPLVSFWNAPEFGYYVGSSASVTMAGPGGDMMVYTSAQVTIAPAGVTTTSLVLTSDYVRCASSAVLTTANADARPYIVIPVSTGNMSSADTPASLGGGCALVWAQSTVDPGTAGVLWAYTTASTGWMTSTSGAAWTSTSTGLA